MKIQFLGGSTFLIKTKTATVILDPTSDSGIKHPKVEADICVISDKRFADTDKVKPKNAEKGLFVIDGQGEYEISQVFVDVTAYHGKAVEEDKDCVVRIRAEGINIVYLGYMNSPLTKAEIEDFDTVDILITPVGDQALISPDAVESVISLADPGILIPASFKEGGVHSKLKEIGTLKEFLNRVGTKTTEQEKTLKVKEKDFGAEDDVPMRIVVLEQK